MYLLSMTRVLDVVKVSLKCNCTTEKKLKTRYHGTDKAPPHPLPMLSSGQTPSSCAEGAAACMLSASIRRAAWHDLPIFIHQKTPTLTLKTLLPSAVAPTLTSHLSFKITFYCSAPLDRPGQLQTTECLKGRAFPQKH